MREGDTMVMLYFSGTGNSKYIANLFSENVGAKCSSIELNIDFQSIIEENDTIAFCYPIYGINNCEVIKNIALILEAKNNTSLIILVKNSMSL